MLLREHKGDLASLSDEEWLDFAQVTKGLERAIRNAFGADMFNWSCLMNDAYKKDPPSPHVHWHVRPRYKDPVEFEGMTFNDNDFAHHYDRSEPDKAGQELQDAIANKLRSALNT